MNDTPSPESKPESPPAESEDVKSFEEAAGEDQVGIVEEFIWFLRENKAWWLVPILLALALIGVAVWLSSSAAAPFIYPLF